jgi:hypothetical protein
VEIANSITCLRIRSSAIGFRLLSGSNKNLLFTEAVHHLPAQFSPMADFLSWLSRAKPSKIAPPRVETDTVVPLRFFDDTAPLRSSIVAWTFRINDVLDPQKLHVAATRLLNLPSWRQLGGRLRLNVGLTGKKYRQELRISKGNRKTRTSYSSGFYGGPAGTTI